MSLTSWNIPAASFSWSVVGVGAVLGEKTTNPVLGKKKQNRRKRRWQRVGERERGPIPNEPHFQNPGNLALSSCIECRNNSHTYLLTVIFYVPF